MSVGTRDCGRSNSGTQIVSVMNLVAPANLNESYAAVPASVPAARRVLTDLAAGAGATREQIEAVRLAASETLSNVVIHAYRGGDPGLIHVSAAIASGELWLLIADDGCGLQPGTDSPGLGVGLALIAQACDSLAIVKRSSGGTEVRMRFSLGAAAPAPDGHARGSSESDSRPASIALLDHDDPPLKITQV
jgi:serine/threonine-protein kinase RsbW